MADELQTGSEQVLIREMGITEANIERRKKAVSFGSDDLARIAAIKDVVCPHIEEYAATFFNHLSGLEDSKGLFAKRDILDKARRLKAEHLAAMVGGDYGATYVEQRMKLGTLYNKVGLEQRSFLGAFHALLRHIGVMVMKRGERTPLEAFENFMALKKLAFFDIGVIVDVMVFERERVIRQQQEAIRELSTPVLQVRERLLLLPIIGVIDTHRARLITENLLRSIRSNRAKVVVMDVTGVSTIDSKVANHLLQTVTAARLMGAQVIVTGLSSDVAQSLVALGIELSRFNTVGDLQGGLDEAERLLGYRVMQGPTMPLTQAANGTGDSADANGALPAHG
jgi:rsbT co-antagonist protein RsbR